jgi:nicotinamide mononucleotide transporter
MNPTDWIEPVAVVTGILSVALTVRQHILNWPIGILSSGLFLALFLEAGLYADSSLQVIYVALGFYGWWHWLHSGPRGDDLPVTATPARLRLVLVVFVVVATVAVAWFLSMTDDPLPVPDAATTVLSLTAQFLLTRKHIENWPIWIFGVNVPYVAIYLYKSLALTAALQFVFIVLSIAGWAAWRRSMAESVVAIGEGALGDGAIA